MPSNTTRPATAGGDAIRDLAVTGEDGTVVKTQDVLIVRGFGRGYVGNVAGARGPLVPYAIETSRSRAALSEWRDELRVLRDSLARGRRQRYLAPAVPIAPRSLGVAVVVQSVNFAFGAHSGGTQLSINGTGFTGAPGATVGGVALTSFVVVSDILITGITGAHATGVVDVVVGGSSTGGTALFEYVNPISIFGANLKRWYSQQFAVDVWTDESGNLNTSQSNAAARPLATAFPNGHLALAFDGTGMSLAMGTSGGDILGTEGVVAMIGYQAPNSGFYRLWLAHSFGGVGFWFGNDPNIDPHFMVFGVGTTVASDMARSDAAIDDGGIRRFIGYYKNADAPTTTKLVIDGIQQGTTGAGLWGTNPGDTPSIGAQMSTTDSVTANYYEGHMGEVVLANVKPTAGQLARLDAYLRDCGGQAL